MGDIPYLRAVLFRRDLSRSAALCGFLIVHTTSLGQLCIVSDETGCSKERTRFARAEILFLSTNPSYRRLSRPSERRDRCNRRQPKLYPEARKMAGAKRLCRTNK